MTSEARAFAPANISCIFKIYEKKNPRWTGSYGVGFTINEGVIVTTCKSGKSGIFFNNKSINFPTVKSVIEKLTKQKLSVNIKTKLPLGCGFGLSGASALATAYAVNKLLTLKKSKKDLEGIKNTAAGSAAAKASEDAWAALSELETSNIYYFDLNDSANATRHLDAAGLVLGIPSSDLKSLQKDFQQSSATDLRYRAFRALEMRQVSLAYDLFTKNAKYHPTDAWTFGGLSTIYVLLGDMALATENAERSYQLGQNDEYTASALGYVYGLAGRYKEAASLYLQAVQINRKYFPAQFNLSYNYLKLEEFDKAMEILENLDRSFGKVNTLSRAKIRNNIGYALWKTGKHEEAVQRFREALEMSPGFMIAKKNLDFTSGGTPEATP